MLMKKAVSLLFLVCYLHDCFVNSSASAAAMILNNNHNNDDDVKKYDDEGIVSKTTTSEINLFRIVHYESGQTQQNLPIFEATSNAASQILLEENTSSNNDNKEQVEQQACSGSSSENDEDPPAPRKQKQPSNIEVEEYRDGVFVIHNVLSPKECQNIINLSSKMGYTLDAPVSLGRNIRHNENCVWIMDPQVNNRIFDRVQSVLPQNLLYGQHNLGKPIGLNRRWRLYKYSTNDEFKLHTDGSWTGSGIDIKTGKYIRDIYDGKALSWLTFLIYLNDNFDGGNTKFPYHIDIDNDDSQQQRQFMNIQHKDENTHEDQGYYFNVIPKQGSVLCFYHGYHPLSRLHEGSMVTNNGTKYVARTEVLYKLHPEMIDS